MRAAEIIKIGGHYANMDSTSTPLSIKIVEITKDMGSLVEDSRTPLSIEIAEDAGSLAEDSRCHDLTGSD